MDDFTIPAPPEYDGRQGTVIVFLSLFLLVLAFFIVLVSISTVEETKSKAVINSLTTTFATFRPDGSIPSDFTAKEGVVLGGQAFQEELTGIFATALKVAKVQVVQPGRLMQAEMPAGAVFREGGEGINPGIHPFLDRVVAALGGRPPGIRFDMEFTIGAPYTDQGILSESQTLELRRAGGFARDILARGAPPDSVSIGLSPGDPDKVVIRFYVRKRDDIRLEFLERQRTGPG